MVRIPRLVVAAPASGAGKTTVATGLMAALTARGLTVSAHKVGPDYIDPGYHAVATGRPGRNLDAFLVGEDLVAPLFTYGATGGDVAVVEGVMGLFDGRGSTDEASTAHVARLLGAPVVLVVDASAQSRSVAALVDGFVRFDPRIRIGGVVLNRVSSARHEQLLREALAGIGVRVFGALPRSAAVSVPSRHLGLVPAAEQATFAGGVVAALGALVARHCDVDGLLSLAGSAGELTASAWSPGAALGAPGVVGAPGAASPVIAVAGGPAFTFCYPETLECLGAAGARVEVVDPLRDEALPVGTRGLVLGGGFPEVHAAELSANAQLRAAVARLAAAGAPVLAECAGLLYLARSLDGAPMCGVLPTDARMTGTLTLGYREAIRHDGVPVRAHEFHRSACAPRHGAVAAYTLAGRPEGFRTGGVEATYLHVHPAAEPRRFGAFVTAAAGAGAAA